MSNHYSNMIAKLRLEEALQYLGQSRDTGCLLVGTHLDLCQIFVKDGFVVSISFNEQNGESALRIPNILNATHRWIAHETARYEMLRIPAMGLALKIAVARDEEKSRLSTAFSCLDSVGPKDARSYYLIARAEPSQRFELTQEVNVVGRSSTCDLIINDRSVSGRHCLFDLHTRGLFLRDLKSKNGTSVNRVPLQEGQYLNTGDIIELGNVRLELFRSKK